MNQGKIKVQFRQQLVAILKNIEMPLYLYVPSIDRYTTIDSEAIIKYAAKAASIAENDIRATFEALGDAFEFFLTNGHSFKIDGLGTFSLSVRANQALASDADAVYGAKAVSSVGVNFLPAKEVKELIQQASIETEVITDPTTPDFAATLYRRLVIDGTAIVSEGADAHNAGAIAEGQKGTIGGYNLPASGSIGYKGMIGDEEYTGIFTYTAVGKSGLTAEGVFSAGVDVLTEFGGIALTPASATGVSRVLINGSQIVSGQRYKLGRFEITVLGKGLKDMDIKFDGIMVTRTKNTDSEVRFYADIAEGANTITFGEQAFTIEGSNEVIAHVASLTANGVTCTNGESSPVVPGREYSFAALGEGLKNVDIIYPYGTIVVAYKEDERVVFKLTVNENAETAPLTIGDFVVTLTVPEVSGVSVLNVNGTIADGGTLEGETWDDVPCTINFRNPVSAEDRAKVKITVGGGNRDLSWSSDGKSASVEGINYTQAMTRPAVVTYDGATIFNFTVAVK